MTTLKKTEQYKLVLLTEGKTDHRIFRRDGELSYIYTGVGGQVLAKKLVAMTDHEFDEYCKQITFNKK